MFTARQKIRVSRELPQLNVQFEEVGHLWRVRLRRQTHGGRTTYVCPFLDEAPYLCRVYAYNVLDCRTWPYLAVRMGHRIVLALSRTCPIVAGRDRREVVRIGKEVLGPKMLAAARRNPGGVLQYDAKDIMLLDLGRFSLCRDASSVPGSSARVQ